MTKGAKHVTDRVLLVSVRLDMVVHSRAVSPTVIAWCIPIFVTLRDRCGYHSVSTVVVSPDFVSP